MDITEAFAPGGGSEDLAKTDFFDFVVSPPPHCPATDAVSDEEGFLHRSSCRSIGVSYLHDARHDDHEPRDLHASFIKETNNNTLTALPPVSTITGSLTHHHHHHHRNHICNVQGNDVTMDQSDCDYWGDDSKEQTCSILLEDLNKYCWSTHTSGQSHGHADGVVQGDAVGRACSAGSNRQNTDGAIYTLTVLNNEANSMDGLDCCKSPAPASTDSWSMRPSLDLDAILSLEPAGGDHEHEQAAESSSNERFHVIPVPASQYAAEDSGFVESKEICGRQPSGAMGDNNNDWKLSDQNHLQEGSAGDSAESLLRSALQGKLYSGPTAQVVTSSSTQGSSTLSLQGTPSNSNSMHILPDHPQDESMQTCDEDLLLSTLDATTYRPGDYEKLKSIANEVVESYCSLEPVCNVSTATTVMYTLDPASGSLGTITLPADLSQVSTVTVVTAAQQEVMQASGRPEPETTGGQIQISTARVVATPGARPTKKYCRKANRNGNGNGAAANNGGGNGNGNGNGGQQQSGGGGSPSSVQRKERSLHYCSICSKGFKDKYSVNVHIRTHTGEKPFACSLCGKSFRQKAHLAKHYQTHVAQKPSVGNAGVVNSAASNPNPPLEPANTPPPPRNQTLITPDPGSCNPAS